MQTSSQSPQTSTPTIPLAEHAGLFTIINKARLLNGWISRTAGELDPTIRVWHEIFSKYRIPVDAYEELYLRAFDVRQQKHQNGDKDIPSMDATLLVSQWTGSFGLESERRQRQVEAARSLPMNAESVCELCFGTGFKTVTHGGYKGRERCNHQ